MTRFNALLPKLGRKTGARAAVCAVAVGTAVFGLPSASWADDDYFDWCSRSNVSCQTGTEVSSPSGEDKCVEELTHYTTVCINYQGDYVYVYDGDSDSHSAIGAVSTPDAGSVSGRWCRNTHGYGSWARCNFDWVEDTTHFVYGGIRYDSDSLWYTLLWKFSDN
jgi:hypothetical protein